MTKEEIRLEAKKRATKCIEYACGRRKGEPDFITEQFVEFADMVLNGRWHKAWEELPQEFKYVENTMQGRREWTESEQVLVINNHYQKSVDSTRNGEWVRLRNLPTDCDGFKTSYLYWMEIPELPKEEEK